MSMYKMSTEEKRYNFDNPADTVKFFIDAGLVKSAKVAYSDDEAGLLDKFIITLIPDIKRLDSKGRYDVSELDRDLDAAD